MNAREHPIGASGFDRRGRHHLERLESMGIFIDPSELPETAGGFVQLMFLTAVYGYILFR